MELGPVTQLVFETMLGAGKLSSHASECARARDAARFEIVLEAVKREWACAKVLDLSQVQIKNF